MIPAILYASKSSPDDKGSTADQLEQIRRALPQGREEIAAFREENVSGYHGSRGPELESAMAKAVEAAGNEIENPDLGYEAELWVFHSSRLARGSGKKAQGRSLMKVCADLLAEGVQPRSVTDDEFLTNPMLVGVASLQNWKESADKAVHARRGARQRKEAGKPIGATLLGYLLDRVVVDSTVITRRVEDSSHRSWSALSRCSIRATPQARLPASSIARVCVRGREAVGLACRSQRHGCGCSSAIADI